MESKKPSHKELLQDHHHIHLKISMREMRWIAIILSILLLVCIILILFYCLDRREDIIQHSPEHYFASFSKIAALDDRNVNISTYFKDNGKKQVCVFDKAEKIAYCYELSDDHDKIVVVSSCRRSDLPFTTLP